MLVTNVDAREWVGVPCMDPYGEPLGDVAEVLSDRESGAPEWLVIVGPDRDAGHVVPLAGAVPSGRKIRVVPTAERVRTAPSVRAGEDLDEETKRRAAEHYGLSLDRAASPSGLLSHEHDGRPSRHEPHPPGRAHRELVDALRAAHAMEQASLKMLATMRWRDRDEELVHDLALHHKQTNEHARSIRVRLDELEAARARPLDWLAKLTAYAQAQRGRLRRVPEPADIAQAYEFERGEIDLYDRLARLARELGDERTAALCEANRADEVAMALTLRNHRLHADPGARRGQESPFAAPDELTAIAPRS